MRKLLGAAGLLVVLFPSAPVMADEASPYVVGTWEFKQGSEDTDFKFVNPTNLNLRLEYAFFSADGTKFCGCDADDFAPNKTVEYTMADEIAGGLFIGPEKCGSNFGAMKAIAFKPSSNQGVDKDALQVGFQERLNAQKVISAESGLKAIPITKDTQAEIAHIHELCKGAPQ
ncbi:MAG TPA: hypothetical protein VEP67_07605 [Thiobacillaceae bacterium]|nr:hypothetical protein [Thiobacillaceae bacterium]